MRAIVRFLRLQIKKGKKHYYTFRVIRQASSAGDDLKVNGPSSVTKNTFLGQNVSFNGMSIAGGGQSNYRE